MDLGRVVVVMERMPREAAWEARKRKSMDWAFSELRAWGLGRLVVVVIVCVCVCRWVRMGGGRGWGLPCCVVVGGGGEMVRCKSSIDDGDEVVYIQSW